MATEGKKERKIRMAKVLTFTNTKVSDSIAGTTPCWQSHVASTDTVTTDELSEEVAENLKDSAAYIGTILRETTNVSKEHLKNGERVTLDGFVRFELVAEGSASAEDAPWDPATNRLMVNAIAYDAVKASAKDLVPENVLKPVSIQLLGAQDATTFEQNAVVKGHGLLVQGKNVKITAANADEGLYLVNDEGEKKLTVTASTAGTVDATVPNDVAVGVYTLEIRGRSGLGTNRMLVTASLNNFTVKEA